MNTIERKRGLVEAKDMELTRLELEKTQKIQKIKAEEMAVLEEVAAVQSQLSATVKSVAALSEKHEQVAKIDSSASQDQILKKIEETQVSLEKLR